MRSVWWIYFLAVFCFCEVKSTPKLADWLVTRIDIPSKLKVLNEKHGKSLELTNGLISRKFSVVPGFATIDYYSHEKRSSLLRAIQPEAIIRIQDKIYDVGGFLTSNLTRAYLNRTDLWERAKPNTDSFQFVKYETSNPEARYPYLPRRGAPSNITWPPKGLHLSVHFQAPNSAPANHKRVQVITIDNDLISTTN